MVIKGHQRSQKVTKGYNKWYILKTSRDVTKRLLRRLQRITGGRKWLQEVTKGHKGHWMCPNESLKVIGCKKKITGGYTRLQQITRSSKVTIRHERSQEVTEGHGRLPV